MSDRLYVRYLVVDEFGRGRLLSRRPTDRGTREHVFKVVIRVPVAPAIEGEIGIVLPAAEPAAISDPEPVAEAES